MSHPGFRTVQSATFRLPDRQPSVRQRVRRANRNGASLPPLHTVRQTPDNPWGMSAFLRQLEGRIGLVQLPAGVQLRHLPRDPRVHYPKHQAAEPTWGWGGVPRCGEIGCVIRHQHLH